MAINIARTFALSVVSAGLIGGAALGMAGMANAATQTQPTGPGHSFPPGLPAHPRPRPGPLVRPRRPPPPPPPGAGGLARPPRREPHRAPGSRLQPLIEPAP